MHKKVLSTPIITKPINDIIPSIKVIKLSIMKSEKQSSEKWKYIINITNGIASKLSKWTPIANPNRYDIRIIYLIWTLYIFWFIQKIYIFM